MLTNSAEDIGPVGGVRSAAARVYKTAVDKGIWHKGFPKLRGF